MEFLNTFNMYCPNRKLQLYICKVWHTKKENQKHFKSKQKKNNIGTDIRVVHNISQEKKNWTFLTISSPTKKSDVMYLLVC